MKIFDLRWAGTHGIGRFASELFWRMGDFEPLSLNGRPSAPHDPWRVGLYLRLKRPSLYFSPGYNCPIGSSCPFVITVHDLNHIFVPENSSPLKRLYYRHILRPAIGRAAKVLTVSEFSRQQICEWADVDESKVVSVGQAVADAFSASGPVWATERPYFLYVGNQRPHKNLVRLLAAFAVSGLSADFDFMFTGAPSDDLRHQIESLDLSGSVTFLGAVRDEELCQIYRGAAGVALVSLYEGFGLPILEAMACGTPVLTSSVASMPEIAGGAAVLVDPLDVGAIADGLRVLATDSDAREQLRRRGMARANLFTWDYTIKRVREAIVTCA